MHMLRRFWARVRGVFVSAAAQEDTAAELEGHINEHVKDGMRNGLSEVQARREALIRLGGAEQVRQAYRDARTVVWVENAWRDARYALRGFRRHPVFAVTAIATLALGIGATTAVFSVVDPILFRSLPYAHPEQLVSVGLTAPIIPQEFMLGGSYYEWRDNQKPFSALTSETGVNPCDLTEHNPAHLSCASVQANFLPTLGVSPIVGRNFLAEEDRPNGPKVALISYGFWAGHYNHDPGIVNRLIDIDGKRVRVIGVLPREFEMPALEEADVLVPEALDEAEQRKADPGRVMYAFARLKPGVSIPQAAEQLRPVFQYSLSLAPARFRDEVHLRVRSVRDRQMQDVRLAAWLLLGAVIAVLLIACANVASLLLTRAATRERELAVRSALGASRKRLVGQRMIEAILLSCFGAIGGSLLAEALLRIFVAIAPSGLPFLAKAHIDLRVVALTVAVSLLAGLVFGLAPARFRPRPIALAARTTNATAGAWLRKGMVVVQIAASVVLLTGAALLVHSFALLQTESLGMQTHGVVTATISLNRYRYTTPEKQMRYFLQVESLLRRLPGITAVGLSDTVPPGGYHRDHIFGIITVQGRAPMSGGTKGMVAWRYVTPDYFKALNIPIVRGQAFTKDERNSKENVVIISSLLASRLFPGEDPVGKRIQPTPNSPWLLIEGVAANVKNAGLNGEDEPEYYKLRRNIVDDWQQAPTVVMEMKTSLPPRSLAGGIRAQIESIDPTVPVEVETLDTWVSRLADRPRFETTLLSFFALAGLLIAIIGLYGVVAYMAQQRTQEIGIRMALGATRAAVLRLIVREGMKFVVVGGAIGLGAAIALTRIMRSVLFGVTPHDPVSFIAVTILMALVALAAILVPARSAMKTDPMTALRWE